MVYVSVAYPIHTAGKMLGLWMGLGMVGGAAGLFAGGIALARWGRWVWFLGTMGLPMGLHVALLYRLVKVIWVTARFEKPSSN